MDGFALTDAHGTGITTYSRGLAAALRASGVRLGLLYGRPLPNRLDPTEREVRFFDANGRGGRPLPGRLLGLARDLGGAKAVRVPLSGVVDTALSAAIHYETFSTSNVPPADEVWNSDDLFGRAAVRITLAPGRMPVRVARGGRPPALMHWTHVHPLRLVGALNVYSIHDLIPLRLPWAMPDRKREWLRAVRTIAAGADHIVTVSENSRRDIVQLLGVPEERVTNLFQPIAPPSVAMPHGMSAARLRNTYGLDERGYFLFVSSIEPRKNLARLMEAYMATDIAAPLILVGRRYSHAGDELRVLAAEGGTRSRDGRIRHLGYLPRQDVEMLMRHARALCFPSMYEGFGLPAAEAMQLGTPVLSSDNSAMPEIVGEAALMVPPADTRRMAEALVALDADAELRERLGAAGPTQAAKFSPARYAERLARLHERLGVVAAP
jgi:glycosyltransferase involved in cell wall biosynthesis